MEWINKPHHWPVEITVYTPILHLWKELNSYQHYYLPVYITYPLGAYYALRIDLYLHYPYPPTCIILDIRISSLTEKNLNPGNITTFRSLMKLGLTKLVPLIIHLRNLQTIFIEFFFIWDLIFCFSYFIYQKTNFPFVYNFSLNSTKGFLVQLR